MLEQQTAKVLSREDTEMLSKLQKKYDGRVPDEDKIVEIRAKIASFTNKEIAIHAEENVKSTEYGIVLYKKFENHTPTEDDLAQIDDAFDEYERAEKAYAETPDYIVEHADRSSSVHQGFNQQYLIMAEIRHLLPLRGEGCGIEGT